VAWCTSVVFSTCRAPATTTALQRLDRLAAAHVLLNLQAGKKTPVIDVVIPTR
jgi:hypothetical protein